MKTLVWTRTFVRALQRTLRQHPELRAKIEKTLKQLAEDPFHPSLRSHKLKGELEGVWACAVSYEHRILFKFVQNPETGVREHDPPVNNETYGSAGAFPERCSTAVAHKGSDECRIISPEQAVDSLSKGVISLCTKFGRLGRL
jgi:mRNA-degrading endonuclease YafQ of YafQ-DinJ toxin-antitoxin module